MSAPNANNGIMNHPSAHMPAGSTVPIAPEPNWIHLLDSLLNLVPVDIAYASAIASSSASAVESVPPVAPAPQNPHICHE